MIDDPEEKLSRIMGDVLAHKLCRRAQGLKNTFADQLREYVYFEVKCFPTRKQVEKFYADVEALQKQVDALP